MKISSICTAASDGKKRKREMTEDEDEEDETDDDEGEEELRAHLEATAKRYLR